MAINSERFLSTSLPRSEAVTYFCDCLQNRCFAKLQDLMLTGDGEFSMITSSVPPAGVDLYTDWSKVSCTAWLRDEITDYLHTVPDSLVLLEDSVSSRSDDYLNWVQHPPYWWLQDRILWPITGFAKAAEDVGQIMAWPGGFQTIAAFSILPQGLGSALNDRELLESDFDRVEKHTTRIVVDVFAGGGYLEWQLAARV